jgi:hypothetical protein
LKKELGALKEQLDHMLAQRKIAESDANMGAPIIIIPKPYRKLQFCINYHGFNVVMVKDLYLLLLMDELRD